MSWRDRAHSGLVSITEHINKQPHKSDTCVKIVAYEANGCVFWKAGVPAENPRYHGEEYGNSTQQVLSQNENAEPLDFEAENWHANHDFDALITHPACCLFDIYSAMKYFVTSFNMWKTYY